MIAIITGDIVGSRSVQDPEIWLEPLQQVLRQCGKSPGVWEIYRGDSFQAETTPGQTLSLALKIKSAIKKVEGLKLDVRIAIGIGEKTFSAGQISQSSGPAFVYSGELLDTLKQQKEKLGIQTPWDDFNRECAVMFKLASVIMNSWTSNTAEASELLLNEPGITQIEMAQKLGIAQSSVNDRIKRGAVYEIMEFETYFRDRITQFTENHHQT